MDSSTARACRIAARGITIFLLILIAPPAARGQETQEEPILDRLEQAVKHDFLSLGAVIRTVGDFIWDRDGLSGHNGFGIAASRLRVSGDLDFGFGYNVQTDFATSPVLLDARLSYGITSDVTLDAGLFKAPFSAEQLISLSSLDFVNRSQVVRALSPGRQVGVAIRGGAAGGAFSYGAGVFNGNGRSLSGNDNDKLMYAGRVTANPRVNEGTFEVGANIAFSEDETGIFAGERLLLGADLRREWAKWLLSAEAIYADFDPVVGEAFQPFGYHATIGYMLDPGRHQLLARWDAFDFDTGADLQFIVLGYNFWPSRAFELQVNYAIPVHDGSEFSDQQILVNFQFAF